VPKVHHVSYLLFCIFIMTTLLIIGTACIVCRTGFMKRYGVHPSLCLIRPLQQRVCCCGSGGIDRFLPGRRRSSTVRSMSLSSKCGTTGSATFVYSVRRKLNTELFHLEMCLLSQQQQQQQHRSSQFHNCSGYCCILGNLCVIDFLLSQRGGT